MYVVVRCPRCLLTIYTAFQFDGKKDLVVKSLDGESLPFYNCPLAICGYHFNTNHDVNLYSNTPIGHKRYVSYGFTIAPRTAETRPFRSKEQVAALAITLDTPQDVPQKPTVREAQVGDKAQAAKDPGQGDGKGDTSVPAVAPAVRVPHSQRMTEKTRLTVLTLQKNKSARFMKWTVSEMEKLKRLANEGLALDAIAQVCLSPYPSNRTCPDFLVSD